MRNGQSVTHFAPTEKRKQQQDVVCGYISPGDAVTLEPDAVTCRGCLDWIGLHDAEPAVSPPRNVSNDAFKLEDPAASRRPSQELAQIDRDAIDSSFSVPAELADQYTYVGMESPPENILGSRQFDEDLRLVIEGDVSMQNVADPSAPPSQSATLEKIIEATKYVQRRPRVMLDVGFPLRGYQVAAIAASLAAEFPGMFAGPDVLRSRAGLPPIDTLAQATVDRLARERLESGITRQIAAEAHVVVADPPPLERGKGHRKGYCLMDQPPKYAGKPAGSKLARKAARGKL